MRRSKTALFTASMLSILFTIAAPVSAQPNGAEGSSDLAASSGEVPPYPGFSSPEGPVVIENGGIRSGYDTFVDCRSDYRVLGEEQARACDEAGFTPLNYPGDDGPVPETPGALPETGGAAPALLGAGALVSTAGLLALRGARTRTASASRSTGSTHDVHDARTRRRPWPGP